jgi:cellulose synthase/poly-beta-1,6-N-acetylglucosamine synthase-like glycosyltransferase
MITWLIIFLFCVAGLVHSYFIFPVFLRILALNKKPNSLVYGEGDMDLPGVSILLAAYNEEIVIGNKIKSSLETSYPLEKIEFLIGSDASTDRTNEIIRNYQEKYSCLNLVEFPGRTGKSGIINQLAKKAGNEILILTDANVMFNNTTIYQLIKHYKNPQIALVGGNIINSGLSKDGISIQEKTYISMENQVKYLEGIIWGNMIGAFGGCYSIRSDHYAPVPPLFFMDDFYITMNVLEKKKKSIFEPEAICKEDVSNIIREEFRRKIRISIGNFQNLGRYKHLLFPLFRGLSFCFFSHKVLRWFGPFMIISVFIANIFLYPYSIFFQLTLAGQLLLILVPFLDLILRSIKVHLNLFRFITHFYLMNLALLVGFVKFIIGVKTNIWQPTQRFQ